MIRSILVAATGDPTDAATFATALAIARPFGAHLDVLHVRADPINAGLAMATGSGSGAITAGLIEQLEADATQREARARDGFEQFCAGAGLTVPGTRRRARAIAGPSAEWHVETGREPDWVAALWPHLRPGRRLALGRRGARDARRWRRCCSKPAGRC